MPGWMQTGKGSFPFTCPQLSQLRAVIWEQTFKAMRQHELPTPALLPHQEPAECSGGTKMSFWRQGRSSWGEPRAEVLTLEGKCHVWVCLCLGSVCSAAQILSAASMMSSRVTVRWQCSDFWSCPMTWWHNPTLPPLQWHPVSWISPCLETVQDVTFLTQVILLPFHISKSKQNWENHFNFSPFSLQVTAS